MKALRWAELVLIYLAVPFILAMFLPPRALYPVLGTGALVGAILLHLTPGFRWRDLLGPVQIKPALALGVASFGLASGLCWLILPDRLWFLLIEAPKVMLMLAIFYPFIHVVPQEIVYRALFYERYGDLFPNQNAAIVINGFLFAFGHLMYWNWIVWITTFAGSLLFSMAYLKPRGFVQAVALHALGGLAVFASGLGWLFYSGGAVAQLP